MERDEMRMREFVRLLLGLGLLLSVVGARADWVVDGEVSGQAATAAGGGAVVVLKHLLTRGGAA
jgi:hypothetical protein